MPLNLKYADSVRCMLFFRFIFLYKLYIILVRNIIQFRIKRIRFVVRILFIVIKDNQFVVKARSYSKQLKVEQGGQKGEWKLGPQMSLYAWEGARYLLKLALQNPAEEWRMWEQDKDLCLFT